MASFPPGPQQGLDGPPPSPANPPMPGQGPQIVPSRPDSGVMPGAKEAGPGADQGLQMVIKVGAEIDRGLMALAQAFPESAAEFRSAKEALQSGLAKALASSQRKDASLSVSPTAPGPAFPGSMSPNKY